jgi:hypothetical protein
MMRMFGATPDTWLVRGYVKAVARVGEKADESIAAPKGHGSRTLRLFPCKPAVFRGPPEGAVIAIVDPGKPTPWWWAKAKPPLWQYFLRLRMGLQVEPSPRRRGDVPHAAC